MRWTFFRFPLNFKGIPYKTEWVEYPNIAARCKELGIKAANKNPLDGSDLYTLPGIYDPSTGVGLSDSLAIAQYLDEKYPETPKLFPNGTVGLQASFTEATFISRVVGVRQFMGVITMSRLNPPSAEYFKKTKEAQVGMTFEQMMPKGDRAAEEWNKFRDGLGKVDAWFAQTDDSGPFLLGAEISWGDIVVGAFLIWLKVILGEDSKQWRDISSWHRGRWGAMLKNLGRFSNVV